MLQHDRGQAPPQPPAASLLFSFVHAYREPRVVGPFASAWIDRAAMREGRGGPVIATLRGREWLLDGARFARVDAAMTAVIVRFAGDGGREARSLGRFGRFTLAGGLAYADETAIAHLGPDGEWFCYDFAGRWPYLVLAAAGAALYPGS